MMNILHISPYFPSLDANHAGGVCMGKEIETLKKWHQVYVLTFEASSFDAGLKHKYSSDSRYRSVKIGRLHRFIHVALEPWLPNYFAARSSLRFSFWLVWLVYKYKIDAIHAEYASMGQYLWIKRLFPHIKFCMTEHDMTAQSYERKLKELTGIRKIYMNFQLHRVLKKEKKYCTKADRLFTFNEKDRRLIEKYYGRKDCQVLNPYYGLEDDILKQPIEQEKKAEGMVCFLGQMGREENYFAAMRLIQIAEKVKAAVPDLQIYIVGNQPPETLKNMENDYVHVTGFVEDVDAYLKRAQISVFPLTLGAGIKLKVLRSLAMGTPVITGAVGAEGIDEEGTVITLAETDAEYEKAMIHLLRTEEERKLRSEESRQFVKEHFGWKQSEKILGEVYGRD